MKRSPGRPRPAQSGATFPTLKEAARLDRRAFLVGLGAAAAATGLSSCGEYPPDELEPGADAGAPDAAPAGSDAGGLPPPDAGTAGR